MNFRPISVSFVILNTNASDEICYLCYTLILYCHSGFFWIFWSGVSVWVELHSNLVFLSRCEQGDETCVAPPTKSFEGESVFLWTLSIWCSVTSVSTNELLALEEFLSVRQSLQWFLRWGPFAHHLPGPADQLCGHGGPPEWPGGGYFVLCPRENILFSPQDGQNNKVYFKGKIWIILIWNN